MRGLRIMVAVACLCGARAFAQDAQDEGRAENALQEADEQQGGLLPQDTKAMLDKPLPLEELPDVGTELPAPDSILPDVRSEYPGVAEIYERILKAEKPAQESNEPSP